VRVLARAQVLERVQASAVVARVSARASAVLERVPARERVSALERAQVLERARASAVQEGQASAVAGRARAQGPVVRRTRSDAPPPSARRRPHRPAGPARCSE
jgi:hypothetical protein